MTALRQSSSTAPATPGPLVVASGELTVGEDLRRLDIRSIGSAAPGDAARVALGLGVAVPEMISAFYRAPTALIEGLAEPTATAIAELLRSLGCEVQVVPTGTPMPEPALLLDVAAHVVDETQFDHVAGAAATFMGCTVGDARRLLLANPPVLLGRVGAAAVEALRRRLGDGVTLLTSNPELARYDLLLGECPAVPRARLVADLRARGFEPAETGPWLLRGVSKDEADAIWATHQRMPGLQIANQDFYVFEVLLDAGQPSPAAIAALTEAGVPREVVPRVFDTMPIVVASELRESSALLLIAALSDAGLEAHAELTTFLQLGVRVNHWPSREATRAVLQDAGIHDFPEVPPFVLGPWSELTARLIRSRLVRAGIAADLTDEEPIDAGRWTR